MDGVKGKLNRSLRLQLSVWLSVTVLATAIVAGAFSFISAFREANEFQDDQLRQVAAVIDKYDSPVARNSSVVQADVGDPDSRLIVQLLGEPNPVNGDGSRMFLPTIPSTLSNGMHTEILNGESWRIFVHRLDPPGQLAVAQQTVVRDKIAFESALHTVMPLIILIPILGILVAILIPRILKPITQLSAELDARSEHDLSALDDVHVPDEIRPFINSISRLLRRVRQSMEMQRRFVADAAHELRSPITALSLQAESLEGTPLPDLAKDRLATLRQGLQRTRSLLDQLLTFARSQVPSPTAIGTVSMQMVFRRVLEDLMPLAESKQIDLGVVSDGEVSMIASEIDLLTLVRNLVDNAIRYTPTGGRIDLSAFRAHQAVVLEIVDSGPGIPMHERSRVFDSFYRIPGNSESGSGLGLSIVKTIVDRMGGEILLSDAENDGNGTGLKISVRLPQTD